MPDDYAANTRTRGTVAVGGSATGVIEEARDVDWFAVELVAGRTYLIDLVGSGADPLADTMLRGIFDDEGNNVARKSRDGGEGSDARIVFTAAETGTHYIAARGETREHTGTYTVRVREHDPDAEAAGAADLGDLAGERLLRSDSLDGGYDATDYYRFTLSETQAVTLVLRGLDARAGLYLEDGDGTVLQSSTRGGTRREKIEATLAAGTYYVRVAAEQTGDNAYTLRAGAEDPENVSEPEGEDLPAATSTAGRVAVGGAVTGNIEWAGSIPRFSDYDPGFWFIPYYGADRDWFAVTLTATMYYQFDLRGSSTGGGTLTHTLLMMRDSDGKRIPFEMDAQGGTGWDSRVYFRPTETGTYYVEATTYQLFSRDDTGTYTLEVHPLDDFPTSTETTGRVTVGGSTVGAIELWRDRDWFAVTLEEGTSYRFDLQGAYTGKGTLIAPLLLGLRDAKGALIVGREAVNAVGMDDEMRFTPTETGTYYVEASGAIAGTGKGTYTLSVIDITDDYGADTDTAGTVAVGGSATGAVEDVWDIDWFAATLEKGKTYRIEVKGASSGDGTLKHPYLHAIHDADGGLVQEMKYNVHPIRYVEWMTFTPAEDATYYLAAGGFPITEDQNHHNAGFRAGVQGTYTLEVAEVADDYSADTDTAGRVAVGGAATGAIEHIGDRDWLAVALEKGETYRFQLKGAGTGDGTLQRPRLYGVHDDEGEVVQGEARYDFWTARAAGWADSTTFTPAEDGTYYVAAGGRSYTWREYGYDYGVGTYTLEVDAI